MKRLVIHIFSLIILCIIPLQSNILQISVESPMQRSENSATNFKINQPIFQNNTEFNGSVTILISSSLYWTTDRMLENLINETTDAVEHYFPNVNLDFVISDILNCCTDVVKQMNNDSSRFNEYLISVGRVQGLTTNSEIIHESWINQTAYNETKSVFKDVAFIDSNVRLEEFSFQDYNQSEAGFIAGAWSALASNNKFIGVSLAYGPDFGYHDTSPFSIMNRGFLEGIFVGIEYVRENYLSRVNLPVLTRELNTGLFSLESDENVPSFYSLNETAISNFGLDSAVQANKENGQSMIDDDIDSIISITNLGDEGIAEVINQNTGLSGFFLNSVPIAESQNSAFLYPNYTYAILKQIETWTFENQTPLIQTVYPPNTLEYALKNNLNSLEANDHFKSILENISQSKISIPSNYLTCRGSGCTPRAVKIIAGFDWILSTLGLWFSYSVISKRFKQQRRNK